MPKIKIPLSETPRYIDLQGEPLGRKPLVSKLLSAEFAVAASGAAASMIADATLGSNIAFAVSSNALLGLAATHIISDRRHQILMNGYYMFRHLTSGHKSAEKLCIDKNPSPNHEAPFDELDKRIAYIIKNVSKNMIERDVSAGLLLPAPFAVFGMDAYATIAAGLGMFVSVKTAKNLRLYYRNHKIETGEWKIVDTPAQQEQMKKTFDIDVPDVSKVLTPAGGRPLPTPA